MPKAALVMPGGTKVTIEGTEDEVADLLSRLAGSPPAEPKRHRRPNARNRPNDQASARSPKTTGPRDLIRDLKTNSFFKTKRGLGDVQKALEEAAHIYPITTLSPVLFRMVRNRELRRIKEDGTWKYVNP